MHARSIRAALFTSLGLVPFGCQDHDATGISEPTDVQQATPDAASPADLPVSPAVNPPVLPDCGSSTPASNASIDLSVYQRSPTLTAEFSTGIYRCDNGLLHRPAPITCHSGLPRALPPQADAGAAGDGGLGAGGDSSGADKQLSQIDYLYSGSPRYSSLAPPGCQQDSDCTLRPLGYCAPLYFGGPVGYSIDCNYGCLQDDDCGEGALCECGDPVGHCVKASCRSDSDCAPGLKCGAWFSELVCSRSEQYSCQSPRDECVTGADCGAYGVCSGATGTRQCAPHGGGACGRPFLVAGEARVATLHDGGDWVAGDFALEPLAALAAEERALAGQHWARSALLEHASIAAFARFTLQLLQLGAPRDLIERSQRAMLDETAHAQACFELAAGYLSTRVAPGCLPMEAALQENTLEQVVVLAFREGCVGETVATLEAREALAGASEPRVQRALERIAPDELQHAELAWRFVRWSFSEDPCVRRSLEAEVARLEAEVVQLDAALRATMVATSCPGLTAHGVLGTHERTRIRRDALAEIVLPCARQLLSYPLEQPRPSALGGPGSQAADQLALGHRV